MSLAPIHQEGVDAAWKGQDEKSCPYTGILKEVWQQGWRLACEAIKRTHPNGYKKKT